MDENYEDENFDDEEVSGAKDNIDSKDEDDDNYGDDDFIDNDEDDNYDDDNYSMASSEVTTSTTGGKTKKKGKKKGKKIKRKTKKKKKKKPRQSEFDEYDEYDMNPEDRMPDPRMAVRMESARIMSNRFMQRHEVKQQMLMRREKRYRKNLAAKRKKEETWRRKMERSPFLVDQVAENERIDEENRVRLAEEAAREQMLKARKAKIKNEIILKALAEASDLDGLRQEKRLIAIEEKRLKALLQLEKASGHRKADLMAAQRAERQPETSPGRVLEGEEARRSHHGSRA